MDYRRFNIIQPRTGGHFNEEAWTTHSDLCPTAEHLRNMSEEKYGDNSVKRKNIYNT